MKRLSDPKKDIILSTKWVHIYLKNICSENVIQQRLA